MTEPDTSADSMAVESDDRDQQQLPNGRYVYCLVQTGDDPQPLSVRGVENNDITVIEEEDIGAVIHQCDGLYDTDDLDQVKQWLLAHQRVVDAAGEAYGTPLPMRFDTIFEGGDENVKQWILEHSHELQEELSGLAGRWEYRVHLFWTPSMYEARIEAEDDELQRLRQRQERSGAGKQFLLEKQYEKRLRELKQRRRSVLQSELEEAVAPEVEKVVEQESQSVLQDNTVPDEKDRITCLAVLAEEANEDNLGNRLDEFVDRDGIEIRFTGPWPPYTFAPELE